MHEEIDQNRRRFLAHWAWLLPVFTSVRFVLRTRNSTSLATFLLSVVRPVG